MTMIPELALPAGFRYLLASEADRMTPGDPIVLLTPGGLEHATVRGFTEDKIRVVLRSGAIVSLDLDDPEFWQDGVVRDRRPPSDGEAVAIVRVDDEPELVMPLKASVMLARQERRIISLEKELDQLRSVVSARLGIKEVA